MRNAALPEVGDGRERLLRTGAYDELVGHLDRLVVDRVGGHAGAEADGREGPHAPAHERTPARRVPQAGILAEIFVHEALDLGRSLQGGQDVDEAEKLDLEGFVADGPVEEPAGPPFAVEEAGRGRGRGLVQPRRVAADVGFCGDAHGLGSPESPLYTALWRRPVLEFPG